MIRSVVLAGVAFSAGASAECTREMLQELADTYVAAQTAGDASLLPLSADLTYAENDMEMDVAEGVLGSAMTIDYTRSFYDTTQCATFTELVAATNEHPYVIHTRMVLAEDDSGDVALLGSVVTDAGDWVFGADAYLDLTQVETWDEIPEEDRDSREVIQAAADAYLDQWGQPDLEVPLGTPCARLEGGFTTGRQDPEANTCAMPAFPQALDVTNRRYVIDETVGAVDVFNDFPWLDAGLGPDGSTPSSNQFRVEGGLVRYIHEITVCETDNCGR